MSGYREVQWKSTGMVHLLPEGSMRALCGGNVYKGMPQHVGRMNFQPDPEAHRCRTCKVLRQQREPAV